MFDTSQLVALAADLGAAAVTVPAKAATSVSKTAEDLRTSAASMAPVLTGELRDSIQVTGRGLTAEVAATAEHAQYIEYGTSRQAPEPFMAPAADRHEPELLTALQRLLGDVL